MIRLRIEDPEGNIRETEFLGHTVTIGRGPENQLVLDHPSVSKHHGRVTVNLGHHLYVDLGSSNGTIVMHKGQALAVTGKQVRGQAIEPGSILRIGPYRLWLENENAVFSDPNTSGEYEVEESIQMRPDEGGRVFLPAPRVSEQFVEFVQSCRATLDDQDRLLTVFRDFIFRIFPQATHLFLLVRDPLYGQLQPVLRTSRKNRDSNSTVSRTLVHRVIHEEAALLCGRGQANLEIQSIASIGIECALCAPLRGSTGTYGVLQVDIRGFSTENFSLGDLELLAMVADFVGMVFDGRRASVEERHRFRTSLDALLTAIEPYEPERVLSARRKAAWVRILGKRLRMHSSETRVARYAALISAMDPSVVETLSYPQSLARIPEVLRGRTPGVELPERTVLLADLLEVASELDGAAIRPLTDEQDSIPAEVATKLREKMDDRFRQHIDCLASPAGENPPEKRDESAA